MNAPSPEHAEAWLSVVTTWVVILGATFALMLIVRLVADLLDRFFPDPTPEDEEPKQWN